MTGQRVLVTGIGGAVGRGLADALADALAALPPGTEIAGVFSGERSRDAFLASAPAAARAAVRPLVCDLTSPSQAAGLARALSPARRTVLVHAAGDVSWGASPEAAHRGNVETTRNAARLARELGARFLLVSSAYTATENWEYRNNYERSKADAERLVRGEFTDLRPAVFACSLVVGHSRTGEITRFHGVYPLLGLVERYQPPFLPGDRHGRIDIVPVDWVAAELAGMAVRMLGDTPVPDVVAAAGDSAPRLSELVSAAVAELNSARRAQGRHELPDVPLVPYRRWDFLRRSVDAWNVTAIQLPDKAFLDRLIGIYRPYFEDARVRPPQGVRQPPPDWREYLPHVVRYWLASNRLSRPPAAARSSRA